MEEPRRNSTIDIIRIIAAFGVITIHVASSTTAADGVGKFFSPLCVPFFYVTSLTYFIYSLKSSMLLKTASRIWWRSLVPYLAWTIVYVCLLVTKNMIAGGSKTYVFWKVLFYGESAVQLYFIPELVLMQVLLLALYLFINSTGKNIFIALILIILVLCYLQIGYKYNCYGVTKPISIITSILSAFWISSILKKPKPSFSYAIAGCFLVIMSIAGQFSNILSNSFPVMNSIPIGGVGLILISISIQVNRLPQWVAVLTTVTLGIYLTHVLFIEAFEYIISKLWKERLYYNILLKLTVGMFVFILSTLLTILLQRYRFTKMLFLGYRN